MLGYGVTVAAAVIFGAVMNFRAAHTGRVNRPLDTIPPMPGAHASDPPTQADDLLALLPGPHGADDVLLSLSGTGHELGLFDGERRTLRWHAGSFARPVQRDDVVADATRVFVVDNPRLTALSLKDGVELWQSALLTELSSCTGCLRVMKDRVVVLQKDGTIQAFDAASGRVVWSLRLERYPRRLFAAGDALLVEHITLGRHERADLDVVDPVDGSTLRTMQPSCLNSAFHRPERPNDGTPLLFDRQGTTMFTVFGLFSHCAQAWDVTTAQRRWNTYLPKWSSTGTAVIGDRALMVQDDDQGVIALDVATGKPRRLVGDAERAYNPVYGQGDEVVVAAAPRWDESRVALWGVDATTGKQRWQFPLSAQSCRCSTR